jgi:DNA repair protein RadA/Sms
MEGTRPILVEIQALASTTSFGLPRRTANGVDFNRLLLLVAVLSKRVGLRLFDQDVFVNVIGGLKISEPAADLAVALAIASSFQNVPLPADLAAVGEVGLSGELRAVSHLGRRLNEAAKLGFRRCLVPATHHKFQEVPAGMEVIPVRSLADALSAAMGRLAPGSPSSD